LSNTENRKNIHGQIRLLALVSGSTDLLGQWRHNLEEAIRGFNAKVEVTTDDNATETLSDDGASYQTMCFVVKKAYEGPAQAVQAKLAQLAEAFENATPEGTAVEKTASSKSSSSIGMLLCKFSLSTDLNRLQQAVSRMETAASQFGAQFSYKVTSQAGATLSAELQVTRTYLSDNEASRKHRADLTAALHNATHPPVAEEEVQQKSSAATDA
jgi:hypothetical protein